MKALLLSAGLGTRLKPITNDIPKCLVPINGKPLLEYWLENLSKIRVNEFLINTHYLHLKVEEFVKKSIYRDKITLVYEDELLNTGGTLLKNKNYFNKDESFFLIHADNLCFCNFDDFINAHLNKPSECVMTMMLFKTDNPSSCGIVDIGFDRIVKSFYEKVNNPPSNLANGAVYICDYSIIEFMESLQKLKIDFSIDVIPALIGKIFSYTNTVYHRDIGTIESYNTALQDISRLHLF